MKRLLNLVVPMALLTLSPFAVRGADLVFQSGATRVSLVELYTSEGCSSCPPAERWLGELRQDPGLWKNFIPVAFHVNYWDHLGWRDVLASTAFTNREHAYAAAWHSDSVYTPCFVRDGAEWRPSGRIIEPTATSAPEAGLLTLTWQTDAICRIDYIPPVNAGKSAARFEVHVALLGNGLISKVRAGENAGRELHHEFAALRLETTELKRKDGGPFSATVTLPSRPELAFSRHAVAAWVVKRGDLVPLQATGGWIE